MSKRLQMYRNLLFEQPVDLQQQAFYNTPLGELYKAIPFDSFVTYIPKPKRAIIGKGCKPWFDVKGGIALQILNPHFNPFREERPLRLKTYMKIHFSKMWSKQLNNWQGAYNKNPTEGGLF